MISDTHLSRQRPFFHHNWEVILDIINRDLPNFVLIAGDLSLNGFANEDDLKFTHEQFGRINCPVRVIPGNHDLGNNISSVDGGPEISLSQRKTFIKYFRRDWWVEEIGSWSFIGLNSLLFSSEFDAEGAQAEWLLQTVARSQNRSIALCLHKPLYHIDEESTGLIQLSLFPNDRKQLFKLIRQNNNIKIVISGHLHEHQIMLYEQAELLWLPSTAFVIDQLKSWWIKGSQATRQVGYVSCDFEDDKFDYRYIQPLSMINHDIGNWLKGGMDLYLQNTTLPFKGIPKPS
jgi:predicted phosphodiesterase